MFWKILAGYVMAVSLFLIVWNKIKHPREDE